MKSHLAYFYDMREAILDLQAIAANFAKDNQSRRDRFAMQRVFEILGEAARKIPADIQSQHPEIPWSKIISLRNFVAHEYRNVDNERLLRTVREELPPLLEQVELIIVDNDFNKE